jgi:hypothetical protein
MTKVVAWAYMMEIDNGLKREQIKKMMNLMPYAVEVVPFHTDVVDENNESLLKANSIAFGFVNNEYFEDLLEIQKTFAAVCNDWKLERKDKIYKTKNGLNIMLLCDVGTL